MFLNSLQEAHIDEKIEKGEGPVMLIICEDRGSVNKVQQQCKALLHKVDTYSCIAFTQNDTEQIQV